MNEQTNKQTNVRLLACLLCRNSHSRFQITRDIFWFCVILVTLVVSFAQMFYTLLVPQSCAVSETDNRECEQSEYYLKVYAILLGDFGLFHREQFTSILSVFLVVFYSFMVVLVLLNVLIAVASDSYEKCLLKSENLFGRARVMMIAELVCFQNLLLRKQQHQQQGSNNVVYKEWWAYSWVNGWSRASMIFFGLSSFVVFCWMVGETVGYTRGNGNLVLSLGSILINVALFVSITVVMSTGREDDDKSSYGRQEWCARGVQKLLLRLLGSSGDASNEDNDVWRGRMHYMQKEMTRISESSWEQCQERIQGLEEKMTMPDKLVNRLEELVRRMETEA
jgi:hypothetical protein